MNMVIEIGDNSMPRGDKNGPNGMGPMTGRGAGFCSGANSPGYMNIGVAGGYGLGRGFHGAGRGAGYGRGFGMGFQSAYAAPVYSKET